MKYKIRLIQEKDGSYTVFIPAFGCGTQGKDYADALYMAKDAIHTLGLAYVDMGKEIPCDNHEVYNSEESGIVEYVDVDFVRNKA